MKEECIRCKIGKRLCNEPCPYLDRIPSPDVEVGDDLFGPSPPAIFVGRQGYPKVNVGPMVPADDETAEDASLLDTTEKWFGRDMDELIGFRGSLVRGMAETDVKDRDSLAGVGREIAMAGKPVDTEVSFEKSPGSGVSVDGATQPMGPSGKADEVDLAENPYVPKKVDYLVGDTDARAGTALRELREDVTVDHQIRLLSAGLLGRDRDRKMVPTRWSITAVDSNQSEDLVETAKDFKQLEAPVMGYSEYLDNRVAVIAFPGPWSFEFVEVFAKGAIWAVEPTVIRDWEPYDGRTGYADTTAGAYYSARLAAAEMLHRLKRQARVVVVREIGPEYIVPLGVWVVRETARKAAENAERVESLERALQVTGGEMDVGRSWEADSPVLTEEREQTSLTDF